MIQMLLRAWDYVLLRCPVHHTSLSQEVEDWNGFGLIARFYCADCERNRRKHGK